MTAAIIALSASIALLVVALLVLGGLFHAYAKKYLSAESERLRLDLDATGLRAGIIDRDEQIRRKNIVIAQQGQKMGRLRARALAGLSERELDDIINGVSDPVREGPDRNAASGEIDVPDATPAREPGGLVGDLLG